MSVTEISNHKSADKAAEDVDERVRMAHALRAAGDSIKSGRATSSIIGDGTFPTSASGQIRRLFESYAPLGMQLPWEMLDYVELLAEYNPDYSQAVENIQMIANSGHEVYVTASSDLMVRRTKSFIEEKSRTIQESHGGIDGIIDKLLHQAATFGAMAGEWVLSDDLREVVDFIDLSPKRIRFFWSDEESRYLPFQKVSGAQLEEAKQRGQEIRGSCIRLNELTFRYYAFNAAPESPYGIPPFLAALSNIAIQRDMVHNMGQIVKKIGLLGMIDLTIERLAPLPGETDSKYSTRAAEYLSAYVSVAEDMARDGGLVHFDDVTFQAAQIGGNAAGATNIHKANEEMVFSGLKSMPSVQGRSYSTTETYAGVAYDIIIRNTFKYQRAVKRMIESGYWLMAQFAGLQPDSISLAFRENRSLNRLQEAQAERIEISNAVMKWMIGLIDQIGVAHELGVSEPATPMETPPSEVIAPMPTQAKVQLGADDSDFEGDMPEQGRMDKNEDDDDEERERLEAERDEG